MLKEGKTCLFLVTAEKLVLREQTFCRYYIQTYFFVDKHWEHICMLCTLNYFVQLLIVKCLKIYLIIQKQSYYSQ